MNINNLLDKMGLEYNHAQEDSLLRQHTNLLRRAEDLWQGRSINAHIWWEDVAAPSSLGWGDHSSHVFQWENQQLLTRAVALERKARALFESIQAARAAACLPPLA